MTTLPNEMDRMDCRICGNVAGNQLHDTQEMFFGMRDRFTYLECNACGTIQLQRVPDLTRYYPSDYYSFQSLDGAPGSGRLTKKLSQRAGQVVRRRAADYYLRSGAKGGSHLTRFLIDRWSHVVVGFPEYLSESLVDLRINRNSHVLDVGSGAGITLQTLAHFGFRHLTGVDPYIADSVAGEKFRLVKGHLADLMESFDLILANHALEHAPNPNELLQEIYRLLNPGHYAIVRIPVVSHAWRVYGTNWVQLDPPRHLFLFTANTFAKLAQDNGFEVKAINYDSTSFQFWGSEQYRRGLPLVDEHSYFVSPQNSPFSAEQIASYSQQAAQLNSEGEGDQAAFYLYKPAASDSAVDF